MNNHGLKIMLMHGHFIAASCTVKEAEETIEGWRHSAPDTILRGISHLPGGKQWLWECRSSAIIGMHTFYTEEQQKPGFPSYRANSGL